MELHGEKGTKVVRLPKTDPQAKNLGWGGGVQKGTSPVVELLNIHPKGVNQGVGLSYGSCSAYLGEKTHAGWRMA